MILRFAVGLVWTIIDWIFSFFTDTPTLLGYVSVVVNYLHYWLFEGATMLYFFFRPTTVLNCMDCVIFLWSSIPLYHFVLWVLKKLPFINIK